MKPVTIYHNPRCTKSRQTLELLTEAGIKPAIVEYLKTPPDEKTLGNLVKMLGIRPAELLRRSEPLYKELALDKQLEDDHAILQAMLAHPILIERPIVVVGTKARLGRPPERVKEIL